MTTARKQIKNALEKLEKEEVQIRLLTLPEVQEAYRILILGTFPDNERKPLAMIERAYSRGQYRCYGVEKDGQIYACAFFVILCESNKMDCLVDYLSVRKDLRGQGIGSQLLSKLAQIELTNFHTVLLEVDDPDSAEGEEKTLRERRLAFYSRNGFIDTGVRARVFGVDYRILCLPISENPPSAAAEVYAALYRSFLPSTVFRRFISLRAEI